MVETFPRERYQPRAAAEPQLWFLFLNMLCQIEGSPWGLVAVKAVSVEASAALPNSSCLNNREDRGEERRVFLCFKGGAGTWDSRALSQLCRGLSL